MSKDTASPEAKQENEIPKDAPQVQPDYAPDANTLTDNRKSDYEQPNLANPDSQKIERDISADGLDDQEAVLSGEKSKVKGFKDSAEAHKFIGKSVYVNGSPEVATLNYVGETHGVLSNGSTVPFSQLSEVKEGDSHPYAGNPAYDIEAKHGSDSATETEDKKKLAKKKEAGKA